jgi:glycosyltransferase involved in cell wall biosynthesis
MPVYNEVATFAAAVKSVLDVDYPCDMELVIVDDGSIDQTAQILTGLQDERIVVRRHANNQGKGAAIRTAAQAATGDYMIVCDADLEYAPEEIPKLLQPVLRGDARVVYGTRTFGSHTAFSFWYVLGNKAVTMFANALFDTWISDLETCFKLMPLALYRDLDIRSSGFGMEAEVTGKLLKSRQLPYEVPISYKARQREEGKKLTWRDGVAALWILTRVRLGSGGRPAHRPPRRTFGPHQDP